jgi:hypothetical protein
MLKPLLTFIAGAVFCALAVLSATAQTAQVTDIKSKPCWNISLENSTENQIASDNAESVYILSNEGILKSIDFYTGKTNWSSEIGGKLNSNIFSEANQIFISNTIEDENKVQTIVLRTINKTTGLTNWSSEIETSATNSSNLYKVSEKDRSEYIENKENIENSDFTHIFTDESNIILVNSGGLSASIKKSDGLINWKKHVKASLKTKPDFKEGILVLYGIDEKLYVIQADKGETISVIPSADKISVYRLIDKNSLVLGDYKGNVKLFSLKEKDFEWKVKTGGEISSISHTSRGILVTSFDNFIYMLSEKSGGNVWKRRFSGRIFDSPLIEKETAIVIVKGEPTAIILELEKGKTINRISLPDGEYFTKPPVFLNDRYIFQTGTGLISYTTKECP